MTTIGPFTFDASATTVILGGLRCELSESEFELMQALASRPRVLRYAAIQRITNTARRHNTGAAVAALREKIEMAWDFAYTIDCEHKQGYRLRKVEKPEWLGVWK